MAGLERLYAMGIQTDPNIYIYTVVKNNNTIKCNYCIAKNKIPSSFHYYGDKGLLTKYSIDGNDIEYNCICNYGHYFIHCPKA